MPLEKLVLILVCVIAAAGATIWLASIALASTQLPWVAVMGLIIPTALVAYIVYRVIYERVTNKEDDHYDHIEK